MESAISSTCPRDVFGEWWLFPPQDLVMGSKVCGEDVLGLLLHARKITCYLLNSLIVFKSIGGRYPWPWRNGMQRGQGQNWDLNDVSAAGPSMGRVQEQGFLPDICQRIWRMKGTTWGFFVKPGYWFLARH